MDVFAHFYYTLKTATDLVNQAYGMVLGTRLTREEFSSFPINYQLHIIQILRKF